MKFQDQIRKLNPTKLLRMQNELEKRGELGGKVVLGGVVLMDSTDLQTEYQKLCDQAAEDLCSESDSTGFPVFQRFCYENNLPHNSTIGDVVKHFILEEQ